MYYADKKKTRTLLLILSLCMNLGLLFYFKYFNFFVDNLNSLISLFGGSTIQVAKILLPIGISFYTFETLTYVIDVYRRIHKPLDNFWEYQLYIILFPKLIAGPIIRYHDIADQIKDHVNHETLENRLSGFLRFSIGLGKKVLIANTMAVQADAMFYSDPHTLDTFSAWIGVIAYTFQIYFDFSGYSDMAIGLCRMMGFKINENFNNPYISGSITEFWRRWHITLGNWMRNYLYIPLGGNRVGTRSRLYFNLILVFLFSGLWHGAAWTFVFWGAYHGFFLIIERAFLLKYLERLPKFISVLYAFPVVLFGWIFFRAETFSQALIIIQHMFAFNSAPQVIHPTNDFNFALVLAIVFSFCALLKTAQQWQDKIFLGTFTRPTNYALAGAVSLGLCLIALIWITGMSYNPFIYFRF